MDLQRSSTAGAVIRTSPQRSSSSSLRKSGRPPSALQRSLEDVETIFMSSADSSPVLPSVRGHRKTPSYR